MAGDDSKNRTSVARKNKSLLGPMLVVFYWVSNIYILAHAYILFFAYEMASEWPLIAGCVVLAVAGLALHQVCRKADPGFLPKLSDEATVDLEALMNATTSSGAQSDIAAVQEQLALSNSTWKFCTTCNVRPRTCFALTRVSRGTTHHML
eukprot:TRINITY_DN8314_c0_g1_i1.p1 TRINITY_DN8314_c0_g1~~TRINITY_DN8314_c0_g1_i1.p1  ORF type:complete len:176 (-),score=34.55 TRINITY_DN8314_c0_g1_i1:69-518(-)